MTYLHTTTPTPCIVIHGDMAIEIKIGDNILSAISRQISEGIQFKVKDNENLLDEIFATSLVKEHAVPTSAQMRYANAISRRLKISKPADIDSSKTICADFISTHSEKFQQAMLAVRGKFARPTEKTGS